MNNVMENEAYFRIRGVQIWTSDELRELFLRTRLVEVVVQKWGVKIMSENIFSV